MALAGARALRAAALFPLGASPPARIPGGALFLHFRNRAPGSEGPTSPEGPDGTRECRGPGRRGSTAFDALGSTELAEVRPRVHRGELACLRRDGRRGRQVEVRYGAMKKRARPLPATGPSAVGRTASTVTS
jgi:hypothetical protein